MPTYEEKVQRYLESKKLPPEEQCERLMRAIFGYRNEEREEIVITDEYLQMIEKQARGETPSDECKKRIAERVRREGLMK